MIPNLLPSLVVRQFVISSIASLSAFALLFSPVAAQTVSTDGENWQVPLTSDGHPDLQGNWTNATLTPMERPDNLGPVLTQEQVVALESGHADSVALRSEPSDSNRPLPPGGDDPVCIDGATTCYDEVWREPGDRVAMVLGEPRSSLVTSPVDGRVPTLTATTLNLIEELDPQRRGFGPYDHPELRPLAERCIVSFESSAGPPMIPNTFYNNNYIFVQTADHILIMSEMVHDARVIEIGDSPRLPAHVRPWMGDSRAVWDGDTLVVDVIHFTDQTWFDRSGNFHSPSLHVVERYTPMSPYHLWYEATIEDPKVFTRPWTISLPLYRRIEQDVRLLEFKCVEFSEELLYGHLRKKAD